MMKKSIYLITTILSLLIFFCPNDSNLEEFSLKKNENIMDITYVYDYYEKVFKITYRAIGSKMPCL
ncbi:MAG: hypothetical protein ACPGTO_11790 [Polaribacter sp.]